MRTIAGWVVPRAGAVPRQWTSGKWLLTPSDMSETTEPLTHIVRVQSGQHAGQARIPKCGRSLLRWALYHAAVGLARTAGGRARLAALKAKRQGDRYAGFKAIVELAAKVLRIVWGVWRSGTPYDPLRAGGLRRQPR